MGKPHKHAEVIHAIADGKDAQFRKEGQWVDFDVSENYSPIERPDLEWRIKPEPKPDFYMFIGVNPSYEPKWCSYISDEFPIISHWPNKLKLAFDGETGKLKSAEIINEQ